MSFGAKCVGRFTFSCGSCNLPCAQHVCSFPLSRPLRPLLPRPLVYVYPLLVSTLHFLYSTYVYTLSHLFWSSQFPSVSKCFHTVVHQRNGVLCPWSRQALLPPHVPELAIRATSPSFYMAFFHIICVLDKSLLLAQVVLKLVTLLRQPPECWGYKCVPRPARRHSQ